MMLKWGFPLITMTVIWQQLVSVMDPEVTEEEFDTSSSDKIKEYSRFSLG